MVLTEISMVRRMVAVAVCASAVGLLPSRADDLSRNFQKPPDEMKPWCYWYWLNNDITAEGITKDLESMARTGIRLAMIGNIEGGGPVKMFSPEWYTLTRHALREAHRVGVEIYMFNAPGWSQTGGPWIKPEQSMRRVLWNELDAQGGAFSRTVRPDVKPLVQDIAVLAVPRKPAVRLTGQKPAEAPAAGGGSAKTLVFRHEAPFKARAMIVRGGVNGKLYAVQGSERILVADIHTGSRNPTTDFLPDGIETFSFAEVTAREFILEPCTLPGDRVLLTSEPMVAQVIEKQMGRMHPDPSPRWDSYIFPATVEPSDPATVIRRDEILNLTDKLSADGALTCTLPAGDWTVMYFGMVTTGKVNSPAPPEASGLEVDKMSRPLVEHHFNAMFGKLLGQLTPEERAAFTGITIDSYEKGSQNWTDGFDAAFKKRNGYDPLALLPVFTGRVVDSAAVSDRFLWDLRRTVADRIATEYVAGLRDIAHRHKLKLWCENYGHWGFPGEFLIYGAHADEIGGEFWSGGSTLGRIECRAASSAAHIYGKRRVYAEAYTSKLNLNQHPYVIKARGEQMFCEGINHFVLHVYAHQPRDGVPGRNPWFGTAFHRNTPWFNQARAWVRYLQRVHYMLQQGEPVADVAVYIGDFAPQMTGPADPVPAGYDFDYMGSDALLQTVHVKDGEMVVHDEKNPDRISTRYRVLAVHPTADETVRPHVRARLDELKAAGIPFIDQVPPPAEKLRELGIAPLVTDETCPVRWKARRLDDGMIFFLSNFGRTGAFEATLRVAGKTPELFHPVTGEIIKIARYKTVQGGARITVDVKDRADSFFVVFREKQTQPSVVNVRKEGRDVPPGELGLYYDEKGGLVAESAKRGIYTFAMSDGTERRVVIDVEPASLPVAGPWQTMAQDEKGHVVRMETTFTVPAGFGKGQRVHLDLGPVSVMAKVTLNGEEFETLWMPPFELDVTRALKAGANTLRVLVASTSQGKPSIGESVQLRSKCFTIAAPMKLLPRPTTSDTKAPP